MKALILTLLIIAISSPQTVMASIPIDDIQVYGPAGSPASPYEGQVVTVEGSVFLPQGILNGGTFYIMGDTGGIKVYKPFPLFLEIGEAVEVQGEVTSFRGQIEIGNDPVVLSRAPGPVPTPAIHAPEEIQGNYEMVGNFVSVIGEVVQLAPFAIYLGAEENDLEVYFDSSAQLDMSEIDVGDVYRVTGAVYNDFGTVGIYPRYQEDLEEISGVVALENRTWGEIKSLYR